MGGQRRLGPRDGNTWRHSFRCSMPLNCQFPHFFLTVSLHALPPPPANRAMEQIKKKLAAIKQERDDAFEQCESAEAEKKAAQERADAVSGERGREECYYAKKGPKISEDPELMSLPMPTYTGIRKILLS